MPEASASLLMKSTIAVMDRVDVWRDLAWEHDGIHAREPSTGRTLHPPKGQRDPSEGKSQCARRDLGGEHGKIESWKLRSQKDVTSWRGRDYLAAREAV